MRRMILTLTLLAVGATSADACSFRRHHRHRWFGHHRQACAPAPACYAPPPVCVLPPVPSGQPQAPPPLGLVPTFGHIR